MANFNHTFMKAKEFDKNRLAAARIRIRYLDDQATECLEDGSPVALFWACEALEEICYLHKHAHYEINPVKGERLTDEMIDRANQYPIESLVEFRNGKAYAFCHEDKSPSLNHWKAKNRCRCFACGKTFRPVDILMERDGMSFKDAVRRLLI